MMDISVSLNDDRLRQALRQAPDRLTARIEAALSRGAEEIARDARRNAPKAFSTLTNSIRAARVGDLHYRVSTGTNYARSVEEGRRPGRQPGVANGLMEWVRQKTGLTGPALDRKTYVIARAIGRRGIKPQPYMQPAHEAGEPRVRFLVEEAVGRGIQEVFGG